MLSFLSGGKKVSVTQKDAHEGVYTFEYTPTAAGDHTVDITWVGQHIAKRLALIQHDNSREMLTFQFN